MTLNKYAERMTDRWQPSAVASRSPGANGVADSCRDSRLKYARDDMSKSAMVQFSVLIKLARRQKECGRAGLDGGGWGGGGGGAVGRKGEGGSF